MFRLPLGEVPRGDAPVGRWVGRTGALVERGVAIGATWRGTFLAAALAGGLGIDRLKLALGLALATALAFGLALGFAIFAADLPRTGILAI